MWTVKSPLSNTNGPFSFKAPSKEEHPGPPFNHSSTGILISSSSP